VPFRQYFAGGIIASGVMSATFVNMGTGITTDRDSGMLKRLAGSPLAPAAYFTGKAISALAVAAAETSILFAAGVAFLGLRPPATPGHAAGTCTTGSSC
jgi:ABC-2 type transport system permease protein